MAFKLKILLNDWFANQMRVPIDLSQAEDIDVYQSGMWNRRKKQQSVLKLLTDPTDSGVPVWLKPMLIFIWSAFNCNINRQEQ